jgi:hypothetical protein
MISKFDLNQRWCRSVEKARVCQANVQQFFFGQFGVSSGPLVALLEFETKL